MTTTLHDRLLIASEILADIGGQSAMSATVKEAAAALAGRGEWLPIESAPKDGTRVLIFSPADGVLSSHYEGGNWQGRPWRAARSHDYKRSIPTHWMPLPAAPTTAGGCVMDAEISRRIGNMESYFRAMLPEYANAVAAGCVDKWAATIHAYIDLVADTDYKNKQEPQP